MKTVYHVRKGPRLGLVPCSKIRGLLQRPRKAIDVERKSSFPDLTVIFC